MEEQVKTVTTIDLNIKEKTVVVSIWREKTGFYYEVRELIERYDIPEEIFVKYKVK